MKKNTYTERAVFEVTRIAKPDEKNDAQILELRRNKPEHEVYGEVSLDTEGVADYTDPNVILLDKLGIRIKTDGTLLKDIPRSCQPTYHLKPHFGNKVLFTVFLTPNCPEKNKPISIPFHQNWASSEVPLICDFHRDKVCPREKKRQEVVKCNETVRNLVRYKSLSDTASDSSEPSTSTQRSILWLESQKFVHNLCIAVLKQFESLPDPNSTLQHHEKSTTTEEEEDSDSSIEPEAVPGPSEPNHVDIIDQLQSYQEDGEFGEPDPYSFRASPAFRRLLLNEYESLEIVDDEAPAGKTRIHKETGVLYLDSSIKAGQIIMQIGGTFYETEEVPSRTIGGSNNIFTHEKKPKLSKSVCIVQCDVFLRRACKANAEVKLVRGFRGLRMLVIATKDLGKGTEVKIDFDEGFETSSRQLECVNHVKDMNTCTKERMRRQAQKASAP